VSDRPTGVPGGAQITAADGEGPVYAVTVFRYADGGRAVMTFGDNDNLLLLLASVITRCTDIGWIDRDADRGQLDQVT
jgi:hypothetical protein